MGTPSGGALAGITSGPHHTIWYTLFNVTGPLIGRSTITGVMKEFQPSGTYYSASSITVGPDGNLWFIEGSGTLGKITPTGVFTQFNGSGAHGYGTVTPGPDGNIWYSGGDGNVVGKISRSGTITTYPVNGGPTTIVAGPDGNMWFTERSAGKIGKIATNGSGYQEFALSDSRSLPEGICVGPDGNIWFTENADSQIGRITLTGVITLFSVPTPNSSPSGIVAGPDKRLWFVERGTINKIGRMTTSGVFRETATPTQPSNPLAITVGPDKNIWFTEESGGKLGRIDLREMSGTDAVYSKITLGLPAPAAQLGMPASIPLTVQAYDLNGQIITGNYPNPIALTDSDHSGRARLSTTVVTSSTQSVFVIFDGKYVNATLGASAKGGAIIQGATVLPTADREIAIPSGPWGAVLGGDRNLWLCLSNGNIGRYALSGTFTQFPAISGFGVEGCSMALGSDNNVWFNDPIGNQIGKITQAGKVKLYKLHSSGGSGQIVEAPDGAVWFDSFFDAEIGRIDTTGNVKFYHVEGDPFTLAVGSDGNLYFSEYISGLSYAVGRLTLGGVYSRAQTLGNVSTLAAAPDGNIWFFGDGVLNKMNTSGVILARYTLPSNELPFSMTSGPERSLWFVSMESMVGRIDSNGRVFAVPTYAFSHQLWTIAIGPGGKVWFTENDLSQIGFLDPNTL